MHGQTLGSAEQSYRRPIQHWMDAYVFGSNIKTMESGTGRISAPLHNYKDERTILLNESIQQVEIDISTLNHTVRTGSLVRTKHIRTRGHSSEPEI